MINIDLLNSSEVDSNTIIYGTILLILFRGCVENVIIVFFLKCFFYSKMY
jgi:hypothetical protein